MSKVKIFNNQTKSKLNELFDGCDFDKLVSKQAGLTLYGKKITFEDIINRAKNHPFVLTEKKSGLLETDNVNFEHIDRSFSCLNSIPKGKETAVIEIIHVEDIPQVRFLHSDMAKIGNKHKFVPPRITIDLSGQMIDAHVGVRINTGYVVKINSITMGKSISDGKIVDTSFGVQPDFVVIAQIVSKHDGIIQSIVARDPEDSGLLTINFTTTKKLDTSVPMQVVLTAYSTATPFGQISLIDSESTNDLFKAKDNRTGRWVKNPKTKFIATKFDTTSKPGHLLLTTFDNSKKPISYYDKQKIKIGKLITLFTSRKREWCDKELITHFGVYNPHNLKKSSEGLVVAGSTFEHNTHCMVFVINRITLFSVAAPFNYDCCIFNGAFNNLPLYGDIKRNVRKMQIALTNLAIGAKFNKNLEKQHPELPFEKLMAIFDYNRSVFENVQKLKTKIEFTHEQLFNERPANVNCYSVNLYNGMRFLIQHFCKDLFTEEQLKTLELEWTSYIDDKVSKQNSTLEGVKRKLNFDEEASTAKQARI